MSRPVIGRCLDCKRTGVPVYIDHQAKQYPERGPRGCVGVCNRCIQLPRYQ